MKKILIAAAIATAFTAPAAFAQTGNFEGFSSALNLNLNSTNSDSSDSNNAVKGIGQKSNAISIQSAYGFAITPLIRASVGGTYNFTDTAAGAFNSATAHSSTKLEKGLSIYFEPGYIISEKTLGYAKVSYNFGKARATGVFSGDPFDTSVSISGVGMGAGIRTMLSEKLFLQVEVNRVQYGSYHFANDNVNIKTGLTTASVGVGYHF